MTEGLFSDRRVPFYIPRNIREFASTRETSDVVALAIFEIAHEGDEKRLWTDPTETEEQAVTNRAWLLADAGEDVLHWGSKLLRRA
jgi:hypothetical protein